jgi:hypothetical protein
MSKLPENKYSNSSQDDEEFDVDQVIKSSKNQDYFNNKDENKDEYLDNEEVIELGKNNNNNEKLEEIFDPNEVLEYKGGKRRRKTNKRRKTKRIKTNKRRKTKRKSRRSRKNRRK